MFKAYQMEAFNLYITFPLQLFHDCVDGLPRKVHVPLYGFKFFLSTHPIKVYTNETYKRHKRLALDRIKSMSGILRVILCQ